MIAQITLLCLASLSIASPLYGVPEYGAPVYDPVYESKPIPYSFAFDTKDEYGATINREEVSDELGNKKGSYGYTDGYGIYRQVDYVADEHGFRAVVKTNEPGTDNQNPADTEILSDAAPVKYDVPAAYAPAYSKAVVPAYAKPVPAVAPVYAKPVAAAAPVVPVYAKPAVAAPIYVQSTAPVYGQSAAPVYAQSASPVYAPVYDKPAVPVYDAIADVPAPAHAYEPVYSAPSYEELSAKAQQPSESSYSSPEHESVDSYPY